MSYLAAVFASLLALLTVYIRLYPPQDEHRRRWFLGFGAFGFISCVAACIAIYHSQQRQNEIIANIAGGDNYPYVLPLNIDILPFASKSLRLINPGDTPLFDIDLAVFKKDECCPAPLKKLKIDILRPTDVYLIMRDDMPSKTLDLDEGNYDIFMKARNGDFIQNLTLKKTDRELIPTFTVWKHPPYSHQMTLIYSKPPLEFTLLQRLAQSIGFAPQ
ncbi:MAG: hypothetical protein WDO70_04940 [Alphaproteobacteria bacterium]